MELDGKSFYRIMNKKISNKMHIPQLFVSQFAGQFPTVVLLSCGPTKLWRVHVGKCEHRRFYFNLGWSDFVHDNGVEINDLLVFRYVKKRRFQVEIFETSGCLKKINSTRPSPGRCSDPHNNDSGKALKQERVDVASESRKCNATRSNVKKEKKEKKSDTQMTTEMMEVVIVKEEKPTSDEMYVAVVDILMEDEEDICSVKDTLCFVLRKLRKVFGVDLVGRKAEVKSIIDTFIMDNSDDDDDELGFVEEFSGSRKRKVCNEVPKKKGEKVMDSDNLQIVKVVKEFKWPEAEGYICSDGPMSKRWIIQKWLTF